MISYICGVLKLIFREVTLLKCGVVCLRRVKDRVKVLKPRLLPTHVIVVSQWPNINVSSVLLAACIFPQT